MYQLMVVFLLAAVTESLPTKSSEPLLQFDPTAGDFELNVVQHGQISTVTLKDEVGEVSTTEILEKEFVHYSCKILAVLMILNENSHTMKREGGTDGRTNKHAERKTNRQTYSQTDCLKKDIAERDCKQLTTDQVPQAVVERCGDRPMYYALTQCKNNDAMRQKRGVGCSVKCSRCGWLVCCKLECSASIG